MSKIDPTMPTRSERSSPRARALYRQMHALWQELQAEVSGDWDRTLPLGDYFVDRWEKARLLGFGQGASVYDSCLVLGDVQVGERTWVGPYTLLDGSGGRLQIGSTCSISAGVQIYTHHTVAWALSGGHSARSTAPVSIGNRCYIGPNTVISMGVTIGEGCIVGANSLVLSDIPAGSKAYGNPCRVVGDAVLPSDPPSGEAAGAMTSYGTVEHEAETNDDGS